MKLIWTILVVLTLGSCAVDSTEGTTAVEDPLPPKEVITPNTLTSTEKEAGWELLFDGTSAKRWKGYNRDTFPTQGWGVKDGELQVFHTGTEEAGFGGDIVTKASYEDFILSVDFALTDTSNSGIFYLVQEVPNTPIWHHAPEYQLLDDSTYLMTYPGLTAAQQTGANYDMHPQRVNYAHPIGEWNTARIEKRGHEVKHFLNDQLVVVYTLYDEDWQQRYANSKFKAYPAYAQAVSGPIGLQDHGHLCRFRNMKIKRLK